MKRHNIGYVGGDTQLGVLEKVDGKWIAHHQNPGEVLQQVEALEEYILKFDETANVTEIDIDRALAQQESASEETSV